MNMHVDATPNSSVFGFIQVCTLNAVGLVDWSIEAQVALRTDTQLGRVTPTELIEAMTKHLNRLGRESYQQCMTQRIHPKDCVSPHALAFAIRNNAIYPFELRDLIDLFPFDEHTNFLNWYTPSLQQIFQRFIY